MNKLANVFQTEHRNGTVSNVTSYSFKFTTNPKTASEKPKETIYMKSFFMEL